MNKCVRGRPGHAEVVQLTFDPDVVSFRELLEIFFTIHDPTTLNRQGADVGTQYRSIILYHSLAQRETALKVIEEIERRQDLGRSDRDSGQAFRTLLPGGGVSRQLF